MNVISYRGPGKAGGLSSALSVTWDQHATADQNWWHIDDHVLSISHDTISGPEPVVRLDPGLIDDHYNYCNEFLWPIMHDLHELAVYRENDHMQYRRFNSLFGRAMLASTSSNLEDCFIHDYQLALLPLSLRRDPGRQMVIFWHIPWPRTVPAEYVPPILEIARALVNCDHIGFHTDEYAHNFLCFVNKYLPNSQCDTRQLHITSAARTGHRWHQRNADSSQRSLHRKRCQLVVAPLGIDSNFWGSLSNIQARSIYRSEIPFVLSVDRADYTKGILARLKAINYFFETQPHWREQVSFVQICGRTRAGIAAFDEYWQETKTLSKRINNRWGNNLWQPLVTIEESVSSAQLSILYRDAAVMLVTSLRDGLNLTAKEYIACQGSEPGVLALSRGAGAWSELGPYCLHADPEHPEQIADTIHRALLMGPREKALRAERLKRQVRSNSASDWWHQFEGLFTKQETARSAQ
jgi:trehalose 6-phosphate synthase